MDTAANFVLLPETWIGLGIIICIVAIVCDWAGSR